MARNRDTEATPEFLRRTGQMPQPHRRRAVDAATRKRYYLGMSRPMGFRFSVATVSVLVLASACSVSYEPARSPHVAVVQERGELVYIREGKHYSHGITGGGLEEAVQGSPRAEREAVLYSRKLCWGLGSALFGLGTAVGGLVLLPRNNGHVEWNTQAYAGLSLVGLGLAAYATGIILAVSAGPHQWDAINIYNDEVDARLRQQFMMQRLPGSGFQLAPPAPVPLTPSQGSTTPQSGVEPPPSGASPGGAVASPGAAPTPAPR